MVFLFFLELLVLFFLSRQLTSELSFLFFNIFRNRRIAVILMAIVFLPGTIIHEFSHAIMAKALFVYVGKMELMPQASGDSLKLGSVEVGKTDILRNFLVGIAPFIVGTSILLTVLYFSFENTIFGLNLLTVGVLYILFVIANTMYSSKKDMEGAIEFFIITLVPLLFLYFLGLRIPGLNWETLNSPQVELFFRNSSLYLGVPLLLDTGIIVFSKIVRR
ncbi:MAG: hypothetical protein Q7T54_02335 [Candidatus Levybacteria bacterium]|nr:hypothetical protein [Candidatus Levybacteria bacterium]